MKASNKMWFAMIWLDSGRLTSLTESAKTAKQAEKLMMARSGSKAPPINGRKIVGIKMSPA